MKTFITSDDLKINYEIEGRGKTLIFIHGWAGDLTRFNGLKDELREDYKLISYDLRGHGKSELSKDKISISQLAKDLKELIDYLKLERYSIIGWSLGAFVALEYLKENPDSKLEELFIIDMPPKILNDDDWNFGIGHGIYSIYDAMKDMGLIFRDFRSFCKLFIDRVDPNFTDEEKLASLNYMADNDILTMAGLWHDIVMMDYRRFLNDLDMPTSLIYGSKSNFCSKGTANYYKREVENMKLYEVEGASHFIVVEKPRDIAKIIKG